MAVILPETANPESAATNLLANGPNSTNPLSSNLGEGLSESGSATAQGPGSIVATYD